MADPNKFKSVSVPIETYKKLRFLAAGKFVDAELTVSKTIEALATRAAKKLGYKNGKANNNT
jgi:hypothetical protein